MGFNVTWHPISREEMRRWYFDRLAEARSGDYAAAMALAREHRMGEEGGCGEACRKGYRDLLAQGAQVKPGDPFDKTHSFFLAMVQGFFRTYFYTRDGIYSGLAEMEPAMARYTLPFQALLGEIENPIKNRIYENYCGGVYIPEEAVPRLLADYESGLAEGPLRRCFGSSLPVFLKALLYAKKYGLGLLEAADVVEPHPLDLGSTVCRSYLANCDLDGVMIFTETARHQAEEALLRKHDDAGTPAVPPPPPKPPDKPEPPKPAAPKPEPSPKKKGFFGRLFGG